MSKDIKFGDDAQKSIIKGINSVSNIVKTKMNIEA